MKLQPASRKEVKRMAIGCMICTTLEVLGFVVLGLFSVVHFNYRMILGAVGGCCIAVLNFTLMCLMIQKATGIQDQKLLKAKVQASYNLRLLVQAGWVIAAFFIPFINVVAAAIPLIFPTVVIYYLQATGKLMPQSESPAVQRAAVPEEENPKDNLNSFEV